MATAWSDNSSERTFQLVNRGDTRNVLSTIGGNAIVVRKEAAASDGETGVKLRR